MLQQQATLPQLQPQMIDPEKWLVSQERLQVRNPDNTPPAERAAFVKKSRSRDLLSKKLIATVLRCN